MSRTPASVANANAQQIRRDAARAKGLCGVCCRRQSVKFKCNSCAAIDTESQQKRRIAAAVEGAPSNFRVCCQIHGSRHRVGCADSELARELEAAPWEQQQ